LGTPVRASDWAFFAISTSTYCLNTILLPPLEAESVTPVGHVSLDTRLNELANEVLGRDDLFIVAVVARGSKGARLIDVYVDGDEGVGIKDLAKISRNLAFALDAEDLIKGKYLLNVSTPGEERALLFERQYNRHVGKTIVVQTIYEDGSNQIEGENLGVSDGVLALKTSEDVLNVPLERISKAKIKLPW